MPKLTEAQRAKVRCVLEVHQRIRQSFEDRQFISQHCHFCNWASNGRTFDEALEANRHHQAAHPEQAEYNAVELTISELQASFHDHDCTMASCTCKCGCTEGPFCDIIFNGGPLCAACLVRSNRGHAECGKLNA